MSDAPIMPATQQSDSRDGLGRWLPGRNPGCGKPFQPGQTGNPKGRPSAGVTILEWVNYLSSLEPSRKELLAIISDDDESAPKQIAAIRLLEASERRDMADYAPVAEGSATLDDLRKRGVDTTALRKYAVHPGEFGTARSLELRDRAGEAFDRLLDRTLGKAIQRIDATISDASESEREQRRREFVRAALDNDEMRRAMDALAEVAQRVLPGLVAREQGDGDETIIEQAGTDPK